MLFAVLRANFRMPPALLKKAKNLKCTANHHVRRRCIQRLFRRTTTEINVWRESASHGETGEKDEKKTDILISLRIQIVLRILLDTTNEADGFDTKMDMIQRASNNFVNVI